MRGAADVAGRLVRCAASGLLCFLACRMTNFMAAAPPAVESCGRRGVELRPRRTRCLRCVVVASCNTFCAVVGRDVHDECAESAAVARGVIAVRFFSLSGHTAAP